MKRKEINDKVKVNGYYVNEFTRGFLGEQDEGSWMLEQMGLRSEVVPFSVIAFFQNKRACWKDKDSNTASISFKLKPNQIECFGSYLKKKKLFVFFVNGDGMKTQK